MEHMRHFKLQRKRESHKEIHSETTNLEVTQAIVGSPRSAGIFSRQTYSRKRKSSAQVQTSLSHVKSLRRLDTKGAESQALVLYERSIRASPAPTSWPHDQGSSPYLNGPNLLLNKIDVTLSDELTYSTPSGDGKLRTDTGCQYYSENVANRKVGIARPDGRLPTAGRSMDVFDHALPGYPRVVVEKSRYSEDVANRNINISTMSGQSNTLCDIGSVTGRETQTPSRIQSSVESTSTGSSGLGHVGQSGKAEPTSGPAANAAAMTHPNDDNEAKMGAADVYSSDSINHSHGYASYLQRKKVSATSLGNDESSVYDEGAERLRAAVSSLRLTDESEPRPPGSISASADATEITPPISERAYRSKAPQNQFPGTQVTASNVGIDAITQQQLKEAEIDLSNTCDTEVRVRYAPAITRETIMPTVHHIREKQITREIHHHDELHRILPVKDIEVLPARHFVRASNGDLNEVPTDAVPGATGANESWQIANTGTRGEDISLAPRPFTTIALEGFPQNYEERIDADGVKRSHTTWFYPPVFQDGVGKTGQAKPPNVDVAGKKEC